MGVLARGLALFRDVLVPPTCPTCKRLVADAGALCASCWTDLVQIDAPVCDRLGLPLAWGGEGPHLSAAATLAPPTWDRARAAVIYGPVARRLVFHLKYADRVETAALMGRMMARAGGPLLAGNPLVVPVPLHRRRLLARRFNQAALLAREAIATVRKADTFRGETDGAAAAAEAAATTVTVPAPDDVWLPPRIAQIARTLHPPDVSVAHRWHSARTARTGARHQTPVTFATDAHGHPLGDRDDVANAAPAADADLVGTVQPGRSASPGRVPADVEADTSAVASSEHISALANAHPRAEPEFAPEVVARVQRTRSQVGLSRADRAANVERAFAIPDPARIVGRRIVLVDDVLTTGATLTALATQFKRAGASAVDVLVFARVASETVEPV